MFSFTSEREREGGRAGGGREERQRERVYTGIELFSYGGIPSFNPSQQASA